MSAQPIPVAKFASVLPFLTEDEKLYALRLLKAREAAAPPPKPVSAEELVTLEADLASFVKAAWPALHPGRKMAWDWSDDLICEWLTAVRKRQVTRLIINVPPRTGKTTKATICFPDWTWATDPAHCFMFGSYSAELSTEHSVARRHLITSPWYRALWGDKFALSLDQNEKRQFDNDRRGQMIATSVGGTATGKGADTIIVDDPISINDRTSDAIRKTANDWIDSTLKSRLNDPATGAIVIIMQRVHELDPSGYQLEHDTGWEQVSIPLEAEEQKTYSFPISGRTHLRERDSVIHADRFPAKTVLKLKASRLDWAGLYQQRPAPIEGNLIKRSEVRYHGGIEPVTGEKDPELPASLDMVLLSVDCSFKDLKTSDYVAIGAVGVKGPRRYVLNVVNAHLDVDGTENAILRMRREQLALGRSVSAVLVEDKANGPAVIKRLKKKIQGVVEIERQGGKIARMFAVAPEWQAGDWSVDRNAAWCEPFIQQITIFPAAAHDDMADMMSQAGIHLQRPVHGLIQAWAADAARIEAEKAKPVTADDLKKQPQAHKDEQFGRTVTNKGLGKVMTSVQQTDKCPNCGNAFLSRFGEGQWKCGACGKTGKD